jgi:hypothetical protein
MSRKLASEVAWIEQIDKQVEKSSNTATTSFSERDKKENR